MEVWKSIKGYEGLYEVSNFGRIRSLDRYVKHSKGGIKLVRGSIKSMPSPNPKTGYVQITLYKEGVSKCFLLHRVVAFAFPEICGEYFDGAVVDHTDTIRHNNCASNLKWCTPSENHLNPITREREKHNIQMAIEARAGIPAWNKGKKMPNVTGENNSRSIPIKQIDKNGNTIRVWANAREAAKHFGVNSSLIYNCLRGFSQSSLGYKWEYA